MNTASELQRFALKLADKEEAGIFEMHKRIRELRSEIEDYEIMIRCAQERLRRLKQYNPIVKGEYICPSCCRNWGFQSRLTKDEMGGFRCERCGSVDTESD